MGCQQWTVIFAAKTLRDEQSTGFDASAEWVEEEEDIAVNGSDGK
jgi:hypothetical protein